MIYNAVLVSGPQQSILVRYVCVCVCVCVCIHFFKFSHNRLLQDIEYGSLCYTLGLRCLSIYVLLCITNNPELPVYPSLPFPLW